MFCGGINLAFLVGISWLGVIVWLLFRAIRQFRSYEVIQPPDTLPGNSFPFVTVIIPARNESQNIAACVNGLLNQDYPRDLLEVIIVDDNSTDGTSEIVEKIALSDSRVSLLSAGELPEGWVGKPHACWQGVKTARGEWLCFMDADTSAAPSLLGSAVQHAQTKQADMLSLEPFQILISFWERLVIPAGLVLVSFIVDLRKINDPSCSEAAADGQFILIRRDAYDHIGGHAAVRAELSEDTAMARLLKDAGRRTYLMGGNDLIRVRMYSNLDSLWRGLSRTAVDVVGSKTKTLIVSVGALLLGWLGFFLPVWVGFGLVAEWGLNFSTLGFILTSVGSLTLLSTNIGQTVYFRIPFWYGLLFPIGYSMVAAIAARGVWGQSAGNVNWKDRVYSPGQAVPAEASVRRKQ